MTDPKKLAEALKTAVYNVTAPGTTQREMLAAIDQLSALAEKAERASDLKPCAYRVDRDTRIEEVLQMNGSSLWAVRRDGRCLNNRGEWEYEPLPSSRDDDFIKRCRFPTPEAARAALSTGEPK
jgi:hypothetical protein